MTPSDPSTPPASAVSPLSPEPITAENPDRSTGSWCGRCGAAMRHNVPRLGPEGGYVHVATGHLECADQPHHGSQISFPIPDASTPAGVTEVTDQDRLLVNQIIASIGESMRAGGGVLPTKQIDEMVSAYRAAATTAAVEKGMKELDDVWQLRYAVIKKDRDNAEQALAAERQQAVNIQEILNTAEIVTNTIEEGAQQLADALAAEVERHAITKAELSEEEKCFVQMEESYVQACACLTTARADLAAAREALGGFAGSPFDGTLATGINAISTRLAAAETVLAAVRLELAQAVEKRNYDGLSSEEIAYIASMKTDLARKEAELAEAKKDIEWVETRISCDDSGAELLKTKAELATALRERDEARLDAAAWEDHLDKHSDDLSKSNAMVAGLDANLTTARQTALDSKADAAKWRGLADRLKDTLTRVAFHLDANIHNIGGLSLVSMRKVCLDGLAAYTAATTDEPKQP